MKISQTKFQNLENLFPLFFSPPPRQESIYIALREIMSLFIRNLVNSCQSRPYNISFSTIQTWYRKKNLYSKKSRTKISVKHPSNIFLSLFLFLQRETNKKWEGQTKNGRGNNGRKRERSFETGGKPVSGNLRFDDRRRSPRFNFSIRADSYRE